MTVRCPRGGRLLLCYRSLEPGCDPVQNAGVIKHATNWVKARAVGLGWSLIVALLEINRPDANPASRLRAVFRQHLAGCHAWRLTWSVLAALWFTLAPAALAASRNRAAIIENARVRVAYDLATGTFDVVDKLSSQVVVQSGHADIEGWSDRETNRVRRARITNGMDELGKARRLAIESAALGQPTLLMEFSLHGETNSFVVLRTGIKNVTSKPIRVKVFHPLTEGRIFPGGGWSEVRTLNGDSACTQPRVTSEWSRSSANELLLTLKQAGRRRSLVLGALKTADFTKWASTAAGVGLDARSASSVGTAGGARSNAAPIDAEAKWPVVACLEGYDPVGRLVEPGETYLPNDSFYLDAGTPDPFAALEQYGRQLRAATHAQPNLYDFPTVCAWYAGVWKTEGAQNHPEKSSHKINTSSGLVEEAEKIKARGFLNYSRAAVRLVPDNYTPNNPQGWWDDAHWQQFNYYTAPFETSAKFGQGTHQQGVLAFIYIQPVIQPPQYKQRISLDFRESHRDWLLNRDVGRGGLDYSQPAVQDYLRSRFAALRGHLDGLMVDYCDDLWMMTLYGHSPEPRLGVTEWETVPKAGEAVQFADPKMTATAFYRMFFATLRQGIGPKARIHERNLCQPNNDLTLGMVDSQRTSMDTDKISPEIVSRSGLRWFKNRVVLSYDMDSKELNNGWKIGGWSGSDQDGRRMMLTMAYVAASRLLLANSFRDLSPETLHDLACTFPYPLEPRSARPVDAFVAKGWPRVYDFAVNPRWHQVVLYNNTLPTKEERICVPLSGEVVDGALGLDAGKEYYVFDFWNHGFVGRLKGAASLEQILRPGEARMLSIHEVEPNPQFISSNRHLMQGYLDMAKAPVWNAKKRVLAGASKVVGGETYEIVLALNGYHPARATVRNASARVEAIRENAGLASLKLDTAESAIVEWQITFEAAN
jgi:hypothetical protein